MKYYEFSEDDKFINTFKTHPQFNHYAVSGTVFYNSAPIFSGSNRDNILSVARSAVSLYEMNIDRSSGLIGAFVVKDGTRMGFKTPGTTTEQENINWNALPYGTTITRDYPMSASISRKLTTTSTHNNIVMNFTASALQTTATKYRFLSKHFELSSSLLGRDLLTSDINFVYIPSIFYGSTIKRGSVRLDYYFTGSLIGSLVDTNGRGELIQVSGANPDQDGFVGGIVFYDEGIIMLTGSWDISNGANTFKSSSTATAEFPAWKNYFNSINDGNDPFTGTESNISASYGLSYQGHQTTEVMTLMAHAPAGEVNYSNNPTFQMSSSTYASYTTSSHGIFESPSTVTNVVSSSVQNHSASFEPTTYISKIGLYDEDNNLIGIAKIAKPIKKENRDAYTFKLKLDI
jgi:hypothetical protein